MYRALLICNSRFPEARHELGELNSPKMDGLVLRDALTDAAAGMFEKDDVHVVNEADSLEGCRRIEDFFGTAEPDDTLLLYYSGHGRTLNQQLFLCTRNTMTHRLHSTAISEGTLNNIISGTFAQVKIVILDCCYSGSFKGRDITEGLAGAGRYIIAATSSTEPASDGSHRGDPSPFTRILADGLLSKAKDSNGDGAVDLDDLYSYLASRPFDGHSPHRKFDGSGAVPIANRGNRTVSGGAEPLELTNVRTPKDARNSLTSSAFLDTAAPEAGSFSPERVNKFRLEMRSDIAKNMPEQLTATEFLQRAGLLQGGRTTYAGVLLFSDLPTLVLPSAMVQCSRFRGLTKTDPHESIDLQGPVTDMIVEARDFVANIARLGEVPTVGGAYAETTYSYPMIAVREIIANAVVHRDYEEQESCVQIHAFADRIEVISPGSWAGMRLPQVTQSRLSQLERSSRRRNFRLAQILTWSKLVEGVGAGLTRAIADCDAVSAPEPVVNMYDRAVVVTIFPCELNNEVIPPNRRPTRGAPIESSPNLPLYRQVSDDLRQRIESGEIIRGAQLPTEIELMEKYSASRNTIRDAIRSLTTRGLTETRPGQGTFVRERISPLITTLTGDPGIAHAGEGQAYDAEVLAEGRRPSASEPRVEIQTATPLVADFLQLSKGGHVVSRHQQHFIDGAPWSLQTTFYPMDLVEKGATLLIQASDIPEGALAYLATQLGIRQAGYRDRITVRLPDENEALFFGLALEGGVSVFEVFRTGVDENGTPIRFTISVYPSDRNQFE